MSDLTTEATDPDPPHEPRPGMPRWVKIVVTVAVLLVLTAVALALSGGEHSPGRHLGDDPPPSHTAPPQGGGHTPPPGAHD